MADGDEKARDFVIQLIRTDEGLISALAKFLQQSYTRAFRDHIAKVVWLVSLDDVEDLIGLRR